MLDHAYFGALELATALRKQACALHKTQWDMGMLPLYHLIVKMKIHGEVTG
jgi:hypothetical protein